jgi:hypothetical protein
MLEASLQPAHISTDPCWGLSNVLEVRYLLSSVMYLERPPSSRAPVSLPARFLRAVGWADECSVQQAS